MTSAERVGAALAHRPVDRLPYILPLTTHGARVLGMGLRAYFADARAQVAGQLRLRERLGHDAVSAVYSAACEVEAFGGELLWSEEATPVAGAPPLTAEAVLRLESPDPTRVPSLARVLEVTRTLKERLRGEAPAVGLVLAPYSLPTVQLGLPAYIELLYERPAVAERLWRVNEQFCLAWGLAQRAAGADAIVYVDPFASPQLGPPELWRRHGLPTLARVHAALGGVVFSTASAPLGEAADLVAGAGVTGLVASASDGLGALRRRVGRGPTLFGGLQGLALRRSSAAEVASDVARAIQATGGRGLVLTEHHGEIPFDVPEETLLAVGEAVRNHPDPEGTAAGAGH
jgi:uroporphyrinogen decarboxylase